MSEASIPDEGAAPARSEGIPDQDLQASFDEVQPETQGLDPVDAELGEEGQGDVLAADDPSPSGDGPEDLRVSDLP